MTCVGVGIRGNDGIKIGVTIGIAFSSAETGIDDSYPFIDLLSCTSYDLYGLILRGHGPTLSLRISSTNKKQSVFYLNKLGIKTYLKNRSMQ